MITAIKFLEKQTKVVIALSENNRPHVRVLQILKFENNTLYFALPKTDRIHNQLKKNPMVELLSRQGNTSVKIEGTVSFDVPMEIKKEALCTIPILQGLHRSTDELTYFKIPIKKMEYYDLNTIPPTLLSHII